MFGFGRKSKKKLTAKQARKMVARDRKVWPSDADQDERAAIVEDWLRNGNDIQPDR
jgi:hypothetical protein